MVIVNVGGDVGGGDVVGGSVGDVASHEEGKLDITNVDDVRHPHGARGAGIREQRLELLREAASVAEHFEAVAW